MNKAENSKCLLLNADYTPLKIISWKKAIIWSLKYNQDYNFAIQIIAYHEDRYIQGSSDKKYGVPAVAITKKYFNVFNRSINFSRTNLYIRDDYTCQYCGNQLNVSQLTYDHVIPKSRFLHNKSSSTNWKNIVTACRPCNHKKGNKTPKEAGMKLIKDPIAPSYSLEYLPWYSELITIGCLSEYNAWRPFLENIQCHNLSSIR